MAAARKNEDPEPGIAGTTGLLRHFIYWILPTIVSVAFVLAYFSGIGWLRDLVAPPSNREFGLLEHLEAAILLATSVGGFVGMRRAGNGVEKAVSALVAVGAAFLFLEEIDFGLHYWEYAFGETGLATLNIHNQGKNLGIFKTGSDALVVFLFLLLPLVTWARVRPARPLFRADAADRGDVLAGIAVANLAHFLDRAGLYPNGPLDNNLSEFRETFTYYAFMLYGLELALWRKWPARQQSAPGEVQS